MVHHINHLYKHHNDMSDDEVQCRLEKWDQDQGSAMAHSEKYLRRKCGKNHWSPKLRNAGIFCRYWRLCLKARDRNDYQHTYQRLLQTAQQHDPTSNFHITSSENLTRDEIARHHKEARRNYRTTQQASLALRHKSFNELLTKNENDNDPNTQHESKRHAKIVKTTLRSEEIQANFKNIHYPSCSIQPCRVDS